PGPIDLIKEGVSGAVDDDLAASCARAVGCSREAARASIVHRTLEAGHDVFRAHLVPVDGVAAALAPKARASAVVPS
ncbi:MAG TPA: hypothetical protein VK989_02685, partial [Polyangia bacterium]|nr:hypothetical protein [Polyangia bacterium]